VDDPAVAEQVEIQAKYAGYLDRQVDEVARNQRHEGTRMPPELDYDRIDGLSRALREILQKQKPETLGQASRIPGVTPAAVSLLLVHLKKHGLLRQSA
jgi:tRNA uridine 5-carboxymethylaminomethyl modification enzyme